MRARLRVGYAPLHVACMRGHLEIVELLIAHGADVNAVAEECGTPLRIANTKGYAEVAKFLLQKGGKSRIKGI